MCKCASETHSFAKGHTKKLNESPALSVGPPNKPMEVVRTLEYKTLLKGNRCTIRSIATYGMVQHVASLVVWLWSLCTRLVTRVLNNFHLWQHVQGWIQDQRGVTLLRWGKVIIQCLITKICESWEFASDIFLTIYVLQ